MPSSGRVTCCQTGRNRAYASCGTGSTLPRIAASDRIRRRRSTSVSHHSDLVARVPCLAAGGRRRGQEEAAREAPLRLEALQRVPRDGDADAEPVGRGIRRERAVRARVPGDEVAERIGERVEEGGRDADGQRHAERIAQAPGVFDRGDPRRCRRS